ncbi:hypothetical protein BOX15_Mlig008651g1 [Macrostomum lignano]|uniref:CHCH domain-containing protein n=1 Tax=Macrostomum lignano TaxID=282301 RepID=A0A267FTD9_9PLAT|nr:hypothetical protein BOX15_Mlig030257g2 [Macrostomum lignano]PAA77013.1 hypothetical protein BOX15_Mlig008651g1 [Macrostomum lignano]
MATNQPTSEATADKQKQQTEPSLPATLPSVPSLSPECNQLKEQYDACFKDFFPRFLQGQRTNDCDSLFSSYKECVMRAVKAKNIHLWEVDGTGDSAK